MICRPNNMKIKPVRLTIADLQKEMKGNPNLKSHRVTIPYILSSNSVTPPDFLFRKGVNRYLLSKAEGQANQSRLFNVFGNVHYVNVKPSIFDVIGRLSTTEYQ